MRRLLVLTLVGAVAVGAAAARPTTRAILAAPAASGPMLAFVNGWPSQSLVRVDRATLRVLPGRRLDVGRSTYAWSFSPDRSQLALGGDRDNLAIPELTFVDARRLRALGRVRLARKGFLKGTTWLPGGRVLAIVDGWDEGTILVTVDAARRRVVDRRRLEGAPRQVVHGHGVVAILLAPLERIAPARLAVVRSSGEVEIAVLERVLAGDERTNGTGAEFRQRWPGLAVEPAGGRALVVPAGDEVAEVNLKTLAISYHRLSQRRSVLSRLGAWLEPDAQAKSIEGPRRFAQWLDQGLVAVSGGDYAMSAKGARRMTFRPAGVRLIDTRTWAVRLLAEGADSFRVAGNLLLGMSTTWSSELELSRPNGLSAHELDGRRRFHLYRGTRVWVAYADARRAYVEIAGPRPAEVVDLAGGRVVEQRRSLPVPLEGEAWSELG